MYVFVNCFVQINHRGLQLFRNFWRKKNNLTFDQSDRFTVKTTPVSNRI